MANLDGIITDRIGTYDPQFVDLITNLVHRAILNCDSTDEEEIMDAVTYTMDDGLAYSEDQWIVLKHYQRPQDANWDDAMDYLYNDLYSIVVDYMLEYNVGQLISQDVNV